MSAASAAASSLAAAASAAAAAGPTLSIALVGAGLVGAEFLAQVAALQARAAPAARLRVVAVATEAVAAQYPHFAALGLHVVTPNKKAFSGDPELLARIRAAAAAAGTLVLHESTVGAGLPILSTLNDLVDTGDDIVKIEGIFSGTLSFIFNQFSTPGSADAPAFSSVVQKAKELGYTEPDPRDDLNGLDVARKVVILARLAGIPLTLQSLAIENIVPEPLRQVATADEFLARLPEFDAHFAALHRDARAAGSVLRYVGTVGPRPDLCGVRLVRFPADHPFASLKGSDNIIAFTTRRFPNPLIVQGAGAGAAVTAFGMLSDILKIARTLRSG
ncbi:Homoserine dehydrogenase [Polyrhizophydium stewartii]|uniref:Homoserine dehydrogenase n=1 Tax=Polyrhizophydium stewartii TaxID=2732419 RepID=A0ABR4MZS7_9FUNG